MSLRLAPIVIVMAVVLAPAAARADFGFAPGTPVVEALDASGDPYALAGGHPDRFRTTLVFDDDEGSFEENPKEIRFDFPPGFSGDSNAVPACPRRVFDGGPGSGGECDPESQVGLVSLDVGFDEAQVAVYNVEPAPGELAVAGMRLLGKTPLTMRMRIDDFGLTIEQRDLGQTIPLLETTIELWGVPADHQKGTDLPRRPFLTLPARCDRGPVAVTVSARTWQQPDRTVTATSDTGVPLTGCEALRFDPAVSFDLANPAADSPSGATLGLALPQDEGADDRLGPAVESASIELPAGVSISPSGANGLSACADAELRRGSELPAACPSSSRIGSVELHGRQLREPLLGSLYLGQERPGERFRLFVVAEGRGVVAKFVGALKVDPSTGRITAALDDLPDVSFNQILLRFEDGPRALLSTPLSCAALTATATFESHGDGRVVHSADDEAVARGADGQSCAASPPFAPRFSGGTTTARAGRASGLTLTIRRRGGEQLTDRFSVVLPRGISARIGSVETCGRASLAAVACPAGSWVGSTLAEVGSGPMPASMHGDVFLTGPHRRDPFGLALVFRSLIGPFDFGTTVVRAALSVDPESGRLSVSSDPLPQAIEGMPIRFQTIGLDVDRPGFIRTPTSCAPTSIVASVRSVTGTAVEASSPFAIGGCNALRFAPRLSMRFTERSQLRRDGHPGLRIGIRSPNGGTNLRGVDIALPEALRQDQGGLKEICARLAALEGRCPAASRVGLATATTPLLQEPLAGSLHVVQPEGSGPPELWTALNAMGVRFDVRGRVFSRGGRMHMKLSGLPDVPLSALVMRLPGGKDGILSLAEGPCSGTERGRQARAAFEGQNRAYLIARRPVEGARCGHG